MQGCIVLSLLNPKSLPQAIRDRIRIRTPEVSRGTKRLAFGGKTHDNEEENMPLIQSGKKEAVGKNIAAEEKSGKGRKQAIAIALSVQRKNRKKHMAHGGEMPHEAEALHKSRSMNQKDWQHMNEFAEGGEVDNEDLHPGESVISEPDEGYVYPEHARRPTDHYAPDAEDLPEHMYGHGGMAHPKHIAIIIHSRKMAAGGDVGYPTPKDPHYAEGGDVSDEDEGVMKKIKGMLSFAGEDNPMAKGITKGMHKGERPTHGEPSKTPTPGYAKGGEVDQMADDEDTDDDSEVESLPFEDDDAVNIPTVLKGYDSPREDTEGMHDRKNRHGVMRNIMRSLHRKHYGT